MPPNDQKEPQPVRVSYSKFSFDENDNTTAILCGEFTQLSAFSGADSLEKQQTQLLRLRSALSEKSAKATEAVNAVHQALKVVAEVVLELVDS
jgi:hypothetical protein